jgi:phenylalanyl-tRNA synthetase beta chain
LRFVNKEGAMHQQKMLSGLVLGSAYAEQWGEQSRRVDFFDIKADVEAMFSLTGAKVRFAASRQAALHPGQTAEILSAQGDHIGWLGMLHPNLEKQLGFDSQVFLFELEQDLLLNKQIPAFKPLSKYPSVRRDLALIVQEEVSAEQITTCIKQCAEQTLQDVAIFDIYRGKGVEEGSKSVALSLILQDDAQTLTDSEIDAIFNRVLEALMKNINAKLRD